MKLVKADGKMQHSDSKHKAKQVKNRSNDISFLEWSGLNYRINIFLALMRQNVEIF